MIKPLSVLLLALTLTNNTYSQDVTTKFDVYLDNQKIETDSVYVGVTYVDSKPLKLIRTTNCFTTYLHPNKVYNVVITHPRYQKQTFKIDTGNTVSSFNLKIHLSSKEPDCVVGLLRYNKLLKTCMVYPID